MKKKKTKGDAYIFLKGGGRELDSRSWKNQVHPEEKISEKGGEESPRRARSAPEGGRCTADREKEINFLLFQGDEKETSGKSRNQGTRGFSAWENRGRRKIHCENVRQEC